MVSKWISRLCVSGLFPNIAKSRPKIDNRRNSVKVANLFVQERAILKNGWCKMQFHTSLTAASRFFQSFHAFMEAKSLIRLSSAIHVSWGEIYAWNLYSVNPSDSYTYRYNWPGNSAETRAACRCRSSGSDPEVPSFAETPKGSPEWQWSPPWRRRLHKTEWLTRLTNVRSLGRAPLASEYVTHAIALDLHAQHKENDSFVANENVILISHNSPERMSPRPLPRSPWLLSS